jgi:hypothetical protein
MRLLFDDTVYAKTFLNEKDFSDEKALLIEAILTFDKLDENLYIFKDCINDIRGSDVDVLV